jgi:hypothetical protein
VNRRFGRTYRLHLQGRKNKFSGTIVQAGGKLARWFLAVNTQRATRRYILEDGTLHNHRCENLKSYNTVYKFIICEASLLILMEQQRLDKEMLKRMFGYKREKLMSE